MKTQYYAASSLDGYIATAQNSLDWLLQFGDVEGTSYLLIPSSAVGPSFLPKSAPA